MSLDPRLFGAREVHLTLPDEHLATLQRQYVLQLHDVQVAEQKRLAALNAQHKLHLRDALARYDAIHALSPVGTNVLYPAKAYSFPWQTWGCLWTILDLMGIAFALWLLVMLVF